MSARRVVARYRSYGLTATLLFVVALLLVGQPPAPAHAQIPITSVEVYAQSFNTLRMDGTRNTWRNDETLPDWYASRSSYAADYGNSATGGLYSFGSLNSVDRALGAIASSSTGAVLYGVRFKNTTGVQIDGFRVGYAGEQWRVVGGAPAQKLNFTYKVAASVTSLTGGTWVDDGETNQLDFLSPTTSSSTSALDGNAPTNRVVFALTTLSVAVPPGHEIMFRWEDINDSGSDFGLAIDDLTIAPLISTVLPIITDCPAHVTAYQGVENVFALSATDPNGTVISAQITSAPAGITLQAGPTPSLGGALHADLLVGPATPLGTHLVDVTFQNNDPVPETSTCQVRVDVVDTPTADLSITKIGPPNYTSDIPFDYLITITNQSKVNAASVVLSDTLPSGMTRISDTSGVSPKRTGQTLRWELGTIAAGQTRQINLRVTVGVGVNQSLVNPASVVSDTPDANMANNTASSQAAVPTNVTCPAAALTPISAIQSAAATSPLRGAYVTVEGVVTGDFQGSSGLSGFFMQARVGDGDPATSEGLFVYLPSSNPLADLPVESGDLMLVSGTVSERGGLTQLEAVDSLIVCGAVAPLKPTLLPMPVVTVDDFERYEAMLVTLPDLLTVTRNDMLGRAGQVTLAAGGRLFQPTSDQGATAADNDRRSVVLDDGASLIYPDPIPYIGAQNTLRVGDSAANVTGVLDFGQVGDAADVRGYRLQPTGLPSFARVNQRPPAPGDVGGALRLASLDTYGYFTTIDTSANSAQGADSAAELVRQRGKLVAAILGLQADVIGLVGVENNGATAVDDLVAGVNAAAGGELYRASPAPAFTGDAATRVALIYQPARVTPVGAPISSNDPAFDRPPLAQQFRVTENGARFTAVVNHFASRDCAAATGSDLDQGDGQGCFNTRRTQQAQALLRLIAALEAQTGEREIAVLGNLNAYAAEDPIRVLIDGGLANEVARFVPADERYSVVVEGQSGYLDHALTAPALSASVTGTTFWHINADEPSVLDYNTENKTQDLYSATPYRASEHDPLLMGLNLVPAPPDFGSSSIVVAPAEVPLGGTLTYTATLVNDGDAPGAFHFILTLQEGLNLISAPGMQIDGQHVIAEGTLQSGEQRQFVVVAVVQVHTLTIASSATLTVDGVPVPISTPPAQVRTDVPLPAAYLPLAVAPR